jgi:hypothetical protein
MLGILTALTFLTPNAHAYSLYDIDLDWLAHFQLPDLVCYPVWKGEDDPQESFTIRIENVGDATAPGIWLDVYVSDVRTDLYDIAVGQPGFDYVRTKPLAPGASIEYTFWYPRDLLDHVVETQEFPMLYKGCQIDSFDQVGEWNESNNIEDTYDQIYPDLLR